VAIKEKYQQGTMLLGDLWNPC